MAARNGPRRCCTRLLCVLLKEPPKAVFPACSGQPLPHVTPPTDATLPSWTRFDHLQFNQRNQNSVVLISLDPYSLCQTKVMHSSSLKFCKVDQKCSLKTIGFWFQRLFLPFEQTCCRWSSCLPCERHRQPSPPDEQQTTAGRTPRLVPILPDLVDEDDVVGLADGDFGGVRGERHGCDGVAVLPILTKRDI